MRSKVRKFSKFQPIVRNKIRSLNSDVMYRNLSKLLNRRAKNIGLQSLIWEKQNDIISGAAAMQK